MQKISLQLLHCISFYLSVFGFVHSFEASLYTLTKLSTVSGGKNMMCTFTKHYWVFFLLRFVSGITSITNNSRTGISRILPIRICSFLASHNNYFCVVQQFTPDHYRIKRADSCGK